MSASSISRAPRKDDGLDAPDAPKYPTKRTYKIIVAKDNTYAVEIRPQDADTPLTISGFVTESEAQEWIEGHESQVQIATQPGQDLAD
jgi:hypothetical protein